MAKRKAFRKKQPAVDRFALIEAALRKLKKDELVVLLLEASREHESVYRDLETALRIDKPTELLIADVESAIARATHFDGRMLNRNFPVDWKAYREVERGFRELLQRGELEAAQRLAIDLMRKGSYQVECSDEGLMSAEIEQCLWPIIAAVRQSSPEDRQAWALQMLTADRVGFICDAELKRLVRGN
ncbi:MAG: hypothetical protein ACTHK7_03190 [Aureliella sp.]